ncbi:HEAT repeat domain-containing protein [Singulisphaera sp. Ch08]|uniref:HEAT repeat domain-containing protein n=1 Tax=Singulisphaera sp. Ch08 TaxID=3120278 RepID=A0AAU7CRS6_9BACT
MYHLRSIGLLVCLVSISAQAAEKVPLPKTAEGWKIELTAQAPNILFPTAIVTATDGTLYIGQDPMDMPGPPTQPIDSVVSFKDGKVKVFAEKLWSVMGLEWFQNTLYVVHAPYLSAFRDTDGDGKADSRVDLMTGLGPKLPGFNGINDHVPSGIRLGMDGYLYIAIGDKGIPKGVGKDGTTIQLFGGGVIRIRPDGTGLEVVSTGERNPLSVALSATDDVFTYGNDDDSKKWPNSLTHHIVGGHYGYPYEFLLAPNRALPIVAGQIGGSGAQGLCYNEDGLPSSYRGNLFFCDWGLSTVFRYQVERTGATFRLKEKTPFVTKGDLADFRPFSLAVSADGESLWLVDWAFNSWLADGPQTGRLYHLTYEGPDRPEKVARPQGDDPTVQLAALDHPALAVRLESQRRLAQLGANQVGPLTARLKKSEPELGRLHALWALDAIDTTEAREAIGSVLADDQVEVRLQAARHAGIRRDRKLLTGLTSLLRDRDPAVRREAAIALGKLGDPGAVPSLMAALGDPDTVTSWAIRHAIRELKAWDEESLVQALLDDQRRDDTLKLTDEAWALPVVQALVKALTATESSVIRSRIVSTIGGLYRQYAPWTGQWFGTNPLAGQLPQKTVDWDRTAMANVLRGLALGLEDRDPAVRAQAIIAFRTIGPETVPYLRSRLMKETDEPNLRGLIEALGLLGDVHASTNLAIIAQDPKRSETIRGSALDALGRLGGAQVLRARLSFVYDPKAPVSLIARALPELGREGVLPANDVAAFLEHSTAEIRQAALLAFNPKRKLPEEVRQAVIDRLTDKSPEVRKTAIEVLARLNIREAIPRLLAMANENQVSDEATMALAVMPDPQALPIYLAAIQNRNPELRRAGETALLAIRDRVAGDLTKSLQSGKLNGPATMSLERVLARFQPIADWRVIGPFPRTTAQVFVSETAIDFSRSHTGAAGQTIAWTPRKAEPVTGRVPLNDFKKGAGDRGGFGYDTNGSPNLCAFAYAEVPSDRDRTALLLVGSSGPITLTINERVVHSESSQAGRPYSPDSDLVRVELKKGQNRVLVVSRQGIGAWSFSVRISEPSSISLAARPEANTPERLQAFALSHDGDSRKGESLFFDPKGIGCVKCHSAAGQGMANAGPDLTGLALKYDKAEIIRSVLEPSNRLATGYQPVLLSMQDGKVLTGLVRSESETEIELVDVNTKVTRISKNQVEERRVSDVSLMPKGLADTLSPVEFADLISFLQTLKSAPASPAAP